MNTVKISNIVQQVTTSLNIKLHKQENSFSDLRFESRMRGVDIYLCFSSQTRDKNKVQALFSVGNGRSYEPSYFKKITFSDTKAENTIFKDLMQRLEMDKVNEKIDAILNYRAKKQAEIEIQNAELAAFQRFIPFEKVNYNGVFSCWKNGIYFELSQNKDRLQISTKNVDILLRICAFAAQILEENTNL